MLQILVFLCHSCFFGSPTSEESALDGVEQVVWSGVRRCCSHPAPQTVFSIRFPVVSRSESRGVFLVVLVIWCYLPRTLPQFHVTCFMFLLCRIFTSLHPLRRRVGQADASCSRIAAPQGSVGVSHVSQVSRHMCFSQSLARAWHYHEFFSSLQLNVKSGFGAFLDTLLSLSLPRICLSRSTSKTDALGDDETERGQAAVRCSGEWAMLGSASCRLASPPEAAILNSDLETSHRNTRRHSAKKQGINKSLTPWHSPQTPTAPQRRRKTW